MADQWHIIAAIVSLLVVFVAIVAAVLLVVRVVQSRRVEAQAVANGQEVASAIREIENTLHKICDGMAVGGQVSRDNQDDLRRMISNVSTLVLDVERRLGNEIKDNRDWVSLQFSKHGTNVNFHGGSSGTQIGDGNNQR